MRSIGRSWLANRYLAIDLEGNGAVTPEIVELAAVRIEKGAKIGETFSWLFQPEQRISARATSIHGIRNEDVRNRPRFEEVSAEIASVLQDQVIVGHRVDVDCRLIAAKLPDWSPPIALDTWRLARHVWAGRASYSLVSLTSCLDVEIWEAGPPHRAGSDAFAAAHLFCALAMEYNDGTATVGELAALCGVLRQRQLPFG